MLSALGLGEAQQQAAFPGSAKLLKLPFEKVVSDFDAISKAGWQGKWYRDVLNSFALSHGRAPLASSCHGNSFRCSGQFGHLVLGCSSQVVWCEDRTCFCTTRF